MFEMFQTHVSSVSSVFTHMLQMFYLDVFKNRSGVAIGNPLAAVGIRAGEVEGV
jgi:hypothetical protein